MTGPETLDIRHDIGTSLAVRDGGIELCRYVYRPDTPELESPKPYLHPLRTRSGRSVSLFRPWDHVWHKGIAWSLPVVGEENFWGGPTYVHGRSYVQMDNNGTQRHRRFTSIDASGGAAAFGHELDWITQAGARTFTEHRTLTAQILTPEAWMLTFTTELTNVSGHDIAIGSPTTRGRENAGYGGLFWRGHGLRRTPRRGRRRVTRPHGRPPRQPAPPAAVVRTQRGIRLPQPRTVLQRGTRRPRRRDRPVPLRRRHRRRRLRSGSRTRLRGTRSALTNQRPTRT
jgi:hypothetical protein